MASVQNIASFSQIGSGTDGGALRSSLYADDQGNLYGTTLFGGAAGFGTVYEVARTGTDAAGAPVYAPAPTILASFTGPNGADPAGTLIADAQGNLYGTSLAGGRDDDSGTVFKLARTGTDAGNAPIFASSPTTLVSFNGAGSGSNGGGPYGGLIQDPQGNLYGTTTGGGENGAGTVYELEHTGTAASGVPTYATAPKTLVAFTGGTGSASNGEAPYGSLLADPQGNLYGTTTEGGAYGAGTVFEIVRTNTDAPGAPTFAPNPITLVSFGGTGSGSNGGFPGGNLIADAQGNLYGTTGNGGAAGAGTVFEIARTGTNAAGSPIYASSPTTLVSFDGAGIGTNGGTPLSGLIADARGNLYGTTKEGGTTGFGTVFAVARTGTDATGAPIYASKPTTLVSFEGEGAGTNGANPFSSLIADAKGNLYGTTDAGGQFGRGTVFRINDSGFVVCFMTGTRIRVRRDGVETERPVESLRIGDHAVTASGSLRPITWIGRRHLSRAGRLLPHDQQPIRVRQGAFGWGLPHRDLHLSPGHPVLVGADADNVGGVLVPIMCLINGTSIARASRSSVTYWHVELDSHDILLAEGLPAESYLDWGDRSFFDAASDQILHNPDLVAPGLSARCRPVAVDGSIVEAERSRLDAVFAATLTTQCVWDGAEIALWHAA